VNEKEETTDKLAEEEIIREFNEKRENVVTVHSVQTRILPRSVVKSPC
jgi:hypothetical protein